MRKFLTARRTKTLALLLTLLALVLVQPAIRAHLEAVAILRLVNGEQLPYVLQHTIAEPVKTEPVLLPGNIRGILYTPVHHPHAPGIVVFHGVHHLGIDEPRMIAFAQALSACGLRVLTPELPGIRDYHIGTNSIDTIGQSAQWFAQQAGGPVGVMGLSFSGGLALIAATEPQYAPGIKFVVAVGSQNDMSRVATYYRTGQAPLPDGTTLMLPPHEYGALVLEYEHVEDFVPTADIEPIRAVLKAHLYEDPTAERLAMRQLTPAQHDEALILMNAHAPETQKLLENEEHLRADEMRRLSPSGRLGSITVPVFILHGQADNIIPSSEAFWMDRELPLHEKRAVLVSPIISHVGMENGAAPSWARRARDEWYLVHFFAAVMRAA